MTICNSPFLLKEINIIGGDYQELLFHVSDDSGASMSTEDLQLNFALIGYNNRYGTPLISRNCEVSADDSTAFIMVLYPDDTKDYVGKFIYQITVKAPNNKQQSFQGVMVIEKNIAPNAFPAASESETESE